MNMAELLDYDDDPADTAAALWLATRLGQRTQELAVTCLESALRRAFRCGFLKANDGAVKEIKRLRTALQQIDEGHCLCPDKHDRSECLCWLWISQAALEEPAAQSAESEESKP